MRSSITVPILVLALAVTACDGAPETPVPAPGTGGGDGYVGADACVECHEAESHAWRGSHHDLAMQEVDGTTVLGDFDDARFTHHGVTSTFSRRGDAFVVNTEGDDGALHDYEVAYVFGVEPLQQYLVEFPGGRYQTLPVAWDARPEADGGQRWFHVYGDERIAPGDELFWTGRAQNWNYMCADCHSTNLRRNYDLETDSYATTWSELDVACEACHGPGAEHVEWARARPPEDPDADPYEDVPDDPMGLAVRFGKHEQREWTIDPETGNATLARRDDTELRSCAPCHSRRGPLRDDIVHGRPLLDSYRLSVLDEELYFADGQIHDEVYVFGSFLQSRMHANGVSCGDCHDAHSLRLRAEGNALCTRCHLDTKFDVPAHHGHESGTEGASCAACHMPERAYMVIDMRADHSIRVPRPDLTATIGVPNACNGCHADETPEWADAKIDQWTGGKEKRRHFGTVLHAGRTRGLEAWAELLTLATDPDQPALARASALDLLSELPSVDGARAAKAASRDPDPIVRVAAMRTFVQCPPQLRKPALALLDDPILAVRAAAARAVAAIPESDLNSRERELFDKAFEEFVATEMAAAERPSAHLNLGIVYTDRKRFEDAERAYRTALRLEPSFTQAVVNLADLHRLQGRDADAEALLREHLASLPGDAAAHHALGLTLIRLGRVDEAISELGRAAELLPGNARFTYVHAVSLQSVKDIGAAIAALEAGVERHPGAGEMRALLIELCRESGDLDRAIFHAERLVEQMPRSTLARDALAGLLRERSLR